MELKIPYHSFIDVITNSSTEIYVSCHGKTAEALYELIDSLLKVAGSEKKAKDLFTIEMTRGEYWDDEKEDEVEGGQISFDKDGKRSDKHEDEGGDYEDHVLVITSKEDSKLAINITEQLQKIFNINGSYDG